MAVPKKKTSKARRDQRRSHHALHQTMLTECQNCGEQKRPHHICESCGFYNGKQIIRHSETVATA